MAVVKVVAVIVTGDGCAIVDTGVVTLRWWWWWSMLVVGWW